MLGQVGAVPAANIIQFDYHVKPRWGSLSGAIQEGV